MANKNMLTYFLQQLETTSQHPTWSTILHRRRMKEDYDTWNCPPRKTKCLNMFWVLINKYHRNLRVPPTSQPPQIMPLRGDSHTSTSAIRFVLSPVVGRRRLSFPRQVIASTMPPTPGAWLAPMPFQTFCGENMGSEWNQHNLARHSRQIDVEHLFNINVNIWKHHPREKKKSQNGTN